MKRRLLDFVICPVCGHDLVLEANGDGAEEVESGTLRCPSGHRFPLLDGVPRLLSDLAAHGDDARSIQDSFSREWRYFDYERDRAWASSSEERRDNFLAQTELCADDLGGRVVLDAGCGVGVLSEAISTFGCEVVAGDIGHQVLAAHRHFSAHGLGRTYFLQADLMHPPFRGEIFDVIYSGGVLHHTPDTRATLEGLLPALAPGGRIFVWLYHHVPGVSYDVKMGARKLMVKLPAPLQHALVLSLLPQALLRQRLRIARGHQDPDSRLNAREKLITMLDSYTCRYRWEHTPDEVEGWYRELGFVDVKTTDVGKWGFGVLATKPAAVAHSDPERREAVQIA